MEKLMRRGLSQVGVPLPEGWCFTREVVRRLSAAYRNWPAGQDEALTVFDELFEILLWGEEADVVAADGGGVVGP